MAMKREESMDEKISRYNRILLQKMSVFLNYEPDFIKESIVNELCRECGLSTEEAFSYVLASVIGLDTEQREEDRELFALYFPHMIHCLSVKEFRENPYMQEIRIPDCRRGTWEIRQEHYLPYEAFACNDLMVLPDGRVIPQIGFFTEAYAYPAVLEGGREWMLITPNEIQTMEQPVACARGKVLTYGLGLGYFAFMVSRKQKVDSVTVVEKDERVIALFREFILPQFGEKEKVRIIQADAFDYAAHRMAGEHYDMVFADIWHDPSDGVEAYRRFKALEALSPHTEYHYWIEKTLKFYL